MTKSAKKVYTIISGEGEIGNIDIVTMTADGVKRRAKEEWCGGDRWVRVYEGTERRDDMLLLYRTAGIRSKL